MPDADNAHAAASDEHHDGHGHGPAGEPLGPVDVTTWGYALAGSVLGILVVLALWIAGGG